MLALHPFLMEVHKPILYLLPGLLFFFFLSDPTLLMVQSHLLPIVDGQGAANRIQTYIVHVEKPEGFKFLGDEDLECWHRSFLPNATLDSGEPRLVYSYRHAISGFAAKLTPEEVRVMEATEGFVHAEPDRVRSLATTYTPEFLGLNQPNGAWSRGSRGAGVIIGVLDTGIFPTHPSFDEGGMSSLPAKWKGKCSFQGFSCNKKIIGAEGFHGGKTKKVSPIDNHGHGTHVASIAAGNFVAGAEVLGMAMGTASGMAPKAHLAIYKVCNPGCADSDVLAGIDQAINDGVDVINMSLGPTSEKLKLYQDGVAQGSLSAIKKGIVAVAAAGNEGPKPKTLTHSAPWVLTVGSTSTDRRIKVIVKLGNGVEYEGESAYQPTTFNSSSVLPIVYPGNGNKNALFCSAGSLDNKVKGKIVLCWASGDNVKKGEVVKAAGGAAMILMNQLGRTTSAQAHILPACHVSFLDGMKIRDYVNKGTPTASIVFKGTHFGYRPSPRVATTSSRGPSKANGGILKPDVLAPGVNILAAWPFEVGPNPTGFATSTFNFLSGTSMAAPHVAGISAIVKKEHPLWSPAAIQSAIITSASDIDLGRKKTILDEYDNVPANIFYMGAGQVNASGALDPGLVYDTDPNDYIKYFCGLGYTDNEVKTAWGHHVQCSKAGKIKASDLNYPSIAWYATSGSRKITLTRTAKNVGESTSVYTARTTKPDGVQVHLSHSQLRFTTNTQSISFTVELTIDPAKVTKSSTLRGKLEWVSDKRVVTSPIAISYTP